MNEQERPRLDRGEAVREGVQRAYAAGLVEGRQQAVREIRERATAHYRKYGGLPLAVVERILDGVAESTDD